MSTPETTAHSLEGAEIRKIYSRRFAGIEARRRDVWAVLNTHFFQKWIACNDTVLDVGAGHCEWINSVRAKEKLALDLNPETKDFAAEGVTVITQDVSQPWDVPSVSVNVVITSNFLEHLSSKAQLLHCLLEVRRVLKSGGLFIALGPNIRFAYDVYWDFFDHYLPLSDRSLAEALELRGFKTEIVIPQFLPFTMKGRLPSGPLLVRLYLALPLSWRIFGKQFLVIASKQKE